MPCRSCLVLLTALLAAGARAADRTADTVAALASLTGLPDASVVAVRGYHRPDDDGGGTFRYQAAATAEPDGGSILAPADGKGRFLRVCDPLGDVRAEWFGAWRDGDSATAHDDHAALNACLAAFGHVRLLPGTYGLRGKPEAGNPKVTYHAVDLGPGYRIEGAGRELTRLKLLSGTNPMGAGAAENYFILISNRRFHESADHIVVRDLTLDCNFDGQDKRSTIHALGIRGGDALVERVNFRGYGTGNNPDGNFSRECFVIHQTLVYKAPGSSRRAATLRDLDFTACGHNGDLPGRVGEITHLALGGADNFTDKSWIMPQGRDPDFDPADNGENERNWWPSIGGLVENVRIHDEVFDPATQKSPLNGITYADCIGLTVRGNRVENWEGCALFTMSWWNRGVTIVANEFLNVAVGIALNVTATDGKPNEAPHHEDVLIDGNHVVTGAPPHAPWGTKALSFYAENLPAGVRFDRVTVRHNRFAGRAYTNAKGARSCPIGICFQMLNPVYHDVRFEDNELDFPDFPPGGWVPQQANGLAMMFYPLARWADDLKAGNILYRGNHDKAGQPLDPALVDWYFKNPPTWGRPEGPAPAGGG